MEREEKIDIETKKRLVFAKRLFLHGCSHASNKDKVSRILAIHHFDNAVEIVLRSIAIHQKKEPKGKKYFNFEELLKIEGLPFKEPIRGLHETRNNAQHYADVPSPEIIAKYRGYAEIFFREVCKEIFHISYEELYLAQLIENEELKKKMQEAEIAFNEGKFKKCIKRCDEAFELAVYGDVGYLPKSGELVGYFALSDGLLQIIDKTYPEKYKNESFYEPVKELSRAIVGLGMTLSSLVFLDEYKMDCLKFKQIAQNLKEIPQKKLKENARFSFDFAMNVILKWQEGEILGTEK